MPTMQKEVEEEVYRVIYSGRNQQPRPHTSLINNFLNNILVEYKAM